MLLDENLPHLLRRDLPGLEVRTVAEAGWAGTKNGELLRRASMEFDVFVTADRNLPHQQNLAGLDVGVVVLVARSTKLEDLRPLAPRIVEAAATVGTGQVLLVSLV
ncbi:MAG TPA: DUF5615 family PIN-like protein [Longimicrobiaceae bacterium]|nr:DUF5615 family PIN-like protein [Longimicrobiaceae bacterium]